MEIEKIKQEYNTKLSIKASLPICEAELRTLEENEEVQRYLRLRKYYEENKNLAHRSDDLIFDSVINQDDETITDDVYFSYGKDFIGRCNRMGEYTIDYSTRPFHLYSIRLAKYRNLANPKDEVILPLEQTAEFEQTHNIRFPETENPAQEYIDIRRELYKKAIQEYDESKKLKKEK